MQEPCYTDLSFSCSDFCAYTTSAEQPSCIVCRALLEGADCTTNHSAPGHRFATLTVSAQASTQQHIDCQFLDVQSFLHATCYNNDMSSCLLIMCCVWQLVPHRQYPYANNVCMQTICNIRSVWQYEQIAQLSPHNLGCYCQHAMLQW